MTERVCLGVELDPKYVDVIVQRWQAFTGQDAVLEGDGGAHDRIRKSRREAIAPKI
jgi:DNA modification methylase